MKDTDLRNVAQCKGYVNTHTHLGGTTSAI